LGKSARAGEVDPGLGLEGADRNMVAEGGKRRGLRSGQDELLASYARDRALPILRDGADRDVGVARFHRGHEFIGVLELDQMRLESRIFFAKFGEGSGK